MPPTLPTSLMNLMAGGSTSSSAKATPPPPVAPPKPKIEETPAQKQAAQKLQLRKQLEKTLLQVRLVRSSWYKYVLGSVASKD